MKTWADWHFTRRKVVSTLFRDRIDLAIEYLHDDNNSNTPLPTAGTSGWLSYFSRAVTLVMNTLSQEDEVIIEEHRQKWLKKGLPHELQAMQVHSRSFCSFLPSLQ